LRLLQTLFFSCILNFEQVPVNQLSQANRAAACISFGKNVGAKSAHVTSLYPTSTNDH